MKSMSSALTVLFSGLLMVCMGAEPSLASWSSDPSVNTPVATAGYSDSPQIVTDGSGGAIIVWENYSGGDYNIYAQRIDSHGDALWTANGVAICTASGFQMYPQLASDGSGGAVITWQDTRVAGNNHIYAQRIDASGNVMWTPDGVAVCTAGSNQYYPQIVSDYSGGAIITWTDTRNSLYSDIYAQRIDANGNAVWTTNGVAICTAPALQGNQVIATDGSGGAIIAWQDQRNNYYSIYAQRVDEDGNRLWTGNGIPVSSTDTSVNRMFPAIAYDGSNGVVIAWRQGFDPNWNVYAQRVIINSSPYWTSGGVVVSAAGNGVQTTPRVTDDGSQGAIITWEDTRNSGNLNLFAQRISATGTAQWAANGVAINTAAIVNYAYMEPQTVSDGSGGEVITWRDCRDQTNCDIYAQRVNSSGAVQWTANGVGVATAAGGQSSPQLISNGSNGVIITWQDGRTANDIYAQKVLSNGTLPVINLPTVDIAAITDISYTTATSGGNVTSDGGATVTGRGVCWSTSANPAITDSCTHDGTGAGSFASSITGLTQNTPYHVRAYATNAKGTGYSNDQTFTTPLADFVIPTVTTGTISNVTVTTAAGGGNVVTDGGGTVTARGVCWGISPNPTVAGSCTNDGVGTGSFVSAVGSLAHCTMYHVRAYATNGAGTAYGDDTTFTTMCRLTTSKGGSGTGTVTGTVVGDPGVLIIDCGSTCSADLASASSVDLTASPTGTCSYFKQWGGGICFGNSSPCSINMSTDRTVTAAFENHLAVMLLSSSHEYSTVSAAYEDAAVDEFLKTTVTTFVEDLVFDSGCRVTLEGGFDCTFTTNTGGFSTIHGRVTIGGIGSGGGKVTIEKFIIY